MANDNRLGADLRGSRQYIFDIILQTKRIELVASFARAMSAQAYCITVPASASKIRQKFFVPAPGAVTNAVHKQQRRTATGCRRRTVKQLEFWHCYSPFNFLFETINPTRRGQDARRAPRI